MSVELVSSGSKLKIAAIILIVIQSFILLMSFAEFNKEDLTASFINIGIKFLMLGAWIFVFMKVKNRAGLHISFNQKYLLITDDSGNREIDINKVVSFTKSLISINNYNSWILVFKNETGQKESIDFRLKKSNTAPTTFLNRLEKVKRVKEGIEIPQRRVTPKNAMRRR